MQLFFYPFLFRLRRMFRQLPEQGKGPEVSPEARAIS